MLPRANDMAAESERAPSPPELLLYRAWRAVFFMKCKACRSFDLACARARVITATIDVAVHQACCCLVRNLIPGISLSAECTPQDLSSLLSTAAKTA